MDLMLKHLPKTIRGRLKDIMEKSGTVSDSLEDLRPSDVPVKHHFEFKKDEPVYCKGRRLSPKHNTIVWEEFQKMLKAGIVIPASSEWSSPVVISTKKDGWPRFCVDYRVINRFMRADRWPCLLYTSPSPRDQRGSRMPSSA